MAKMKLEKLTARAICQIRADWLNGTLDSRKWADEVGCSPETIRKIGRRETYEWVISPDSPLTRTKADRLTQPGGFYGKGRIEAPLKPGERKWITW
jgi:hypothetical protein